MIKTILLSILILCSSSTIAQKYYEKQMGWANVQNISKIMVQSDTSFAVFGNYSFFPFVWKISGFVMNINLQGDSICGMVYEDVENTLGIIDATENENGYGIPLNVYVNDQNTYNGLLLVDSCGVLNQRSNYISPLGNTNCYTIARTFDNGYLIGGNIYADYDLKPYLLKVDSLGTFQWERAYTNVPQNGVVADILPAADSSGYFVVSSYNYDDLSYTLKTRITKINNAGDSILLDRIYDFETDYYTGAELVYDYSGNIMMGGVRHPYSYSGYVAKLNGITLDTIWVHKSKAGGCSNIIPLADGNYIIGNCDRNYNNVGLAGQAVIYKLSADGEILWYRNYGGEANDYCYDVTASPDGGYIMAGRTDTIIANPAGGFYSNADIYLVKTNCMGLLTVPQANFTYSYDTTSLAANFYNLSQYTYPDSIDGGYYIWDFGDGNTLIQTSDSPASANFTHLYNKNEPHLVSLTAIVCNDTSTYEQTLGLWATGVDDNATIINQEQQFWISPNPATNQAVAHLPPLLCANSGRLQLLSVTGKLLQSIPYAAKQQTVAFSVAHLPAGIYFVQVGNAVQKLVVE